MGMALAQRTNAVLADVEIWFLTQPLSEDREPRLEWMPLRFRRDKTALIVDRQSYETLN